MSEWVRSERLDVRSLLVLRRGTMVLEWYSGGVTREHNHNIFSVTKSVVATLTGIVIAEGKLSGVESTLADIFSQSSELVKDPRKARVTVGSLLTMRSGFPCSRSNKAEGVERELFDQLHQAPDRMGTILRLPMQRDPGIEFAYGNIEPQIMASILERAAGRKVLSFARTALFDPLGFRNAQWVYADAAGLVAGGYGIRLRAVDLAKLGQLYLQKGIWEGVQVVPAAWIVAATTDQTGTGYGYYWWTRLPGGKEGGFAAKGVRGQQIVVVPDRELVFVVTADLPPDRVKEVMETLTSRFVLNAVIKHDEPLREDPQQFDMLRQELDEAARYVPEQRKSLSAARLPQLP